MNAANLISENPPPPHSEKDGVSEGGEYPETEEGNGSGADSGDAEEEEEDDSESGSESDVSEGGNLNDELYDALTETESTFAGSFYHCSTDPNAPNPGLFIEGLGLIGLPLNQCEAHRIISRSAQAPFGKGVETVVDTRVRDTWEIEPNCIAFTNPRWKDYVENMAFKTVWTTLGVAPYTTKPRCDLYKLLLYQPGSHFLPHQDTAKAPGMFATIIIVLPSAFRGGEVYVSHAGQTKILDVSQSSAFDTSILAWYTDVVHEVKPITAGYRLALSYNLIHTSPNVPKPSLPEKDDMGPLYHCLKKWKRGYFDTTPGTPLVAYLLNHQYSEDDLDKGKECLKGKDANTIAQLLPVAESLGFVVCLGNLTRTVTGWADAPSYSYHKRSRYSYDDSDDNLTMGEIESDEYEISNMVRIDDVDDHVDVDFGKFRIDEECLVPQDPFDGSSPDEEECEGGYMGNYAGSMSQWYRSSVLILFRNEDVMSIGMSLKGNEWGLQQLNACGTPDARSEEIVSAVLRHLDRSADTIVRLAIAWKRPDLWNRAIRHCGPALQTVNTALPAALKAFQLESIKPGIVQLTKQDSALQARFAVIKAIAAVLGPMHSPWIDNLAKDALSSYRAAAVADIPMLIEIARDRGVGIIEASILPHVAKTGTYDFLMNLAKVLLNYRSTLERSPLPSEQTRAAITSVIRQCVLAAMPQWEITTTAPGKGASATQGRANRLSELLDFCFQIEDMDLCMSVAKTASKTGTFDSCFAFARTFRGHVKKLPETNENATKIEDLKKAIRTCVAAAISKWGSGISQAVEMQRVRDLVAFCFKIGSRGFCMTLFNAIRQTASYEVFMELAKTVNKYIPSIGGSDAVDPDVEQAKEDLRQVVRLSLGAAASRWESGMHVPTPHGGYHGTRPSQPSTKGPNPKASRICEFIGLCLSINELGPCVTLFNTLLKLPSKTTYDARFKEIFIPLIPPLKATLVKHGKTPTLEPFASFFRLLISLYLSTILAPNTPETVPTAPPARKAGCANCPHCAQLQAFLHNSNKEVHFRDVQAVRTHVEKEISRARIGDVVTADTIKSRTPYTLVVTKRQEYLSQLVWKTVQAEAAAFVRSIADNSVLKEIMQDRYDDVIKAVQGIKPFTAPASLAIPSSVVVGTNANANIGVSNLTTAEQSTSIAGPSSTVMPQAAPASNPIAGTKRKYERPPNTIAVIDLT